MDCMKPLKDTVRCIHSSHLTSRISPLSVLPCTILDIEPVHSAVKMLAGPFPLYPELPAFTLHRLLSYETSSLISFTRRVTYPLEASSLLGYLVESPQMDASAARAGGNSVSPSHG